MADKELHDRLRNHGRPIIKDEQISGTPTWVRIEDPEAQCPNCGGQLCEVRIRIEGDSVKAAGLRTNSARGLYLGCPACPYASPMVLMAED